MALGPVIAVTSEHTRATEGLEVALLVRRAAEGDRAAWEQLVDKYARLIWAITRDFKLGESDAADVAQATWLRLLEHIDRINYPERVGSWIAATARNECLRSLAARKRVVLARNEVMLDSIAALDADVDAGLLAAEQAEVVREAMSRLPHRWQQLLELLMSDPPVPYAEIADRLDLPVGSIGPTRRRCLARLQVLLTSSVNEPQWQDLGLTPTSGRGWVGSSRGSPLGPRRRPGGRPPLPPPDRPS